MSRTALRPQPLERQYTPDEQTRRGRYSDSPNVVGIDGAIARIHKLFGVTVTEHYVKRMVATYVLPRHIIGRRVCFADRDLFTLIVLATRRTGPTVGPRQRRNGPSSAA